MLTDGVIAGRQVVEGNALIDAVVGLAWLIVQREGGGWAKFLDAVVAGIGDVDVPSTDRRHAVWLVKLAVA